MRVRLLLLASALLVSTLPVAAQVRHAYSCLYRASYDMDFHSSDTGSTGYDGETRYGVYVKADNAAFYREFGRDGWDGATGLYQEDYRPHLSAGETVVIPDICVWSGKVTTPHDIVLRRIYPVFLSSEGMAYTLRLVQVPAGITYAGPTVWGPDHGLISLPYYATDDPLTGYRFEAVITAPPVPEPSSLLALLAGVAGLGGLTFRRRR